MNNHLTHKIRKYKVFLYSLMFLTSVIVSSCLNEDVCEDVATVPVRIGFYGKKDSLATTPPLIRLDSLTVKGLGVDSILYNNRLNVGQIELPLNSNTDSCAFILQLPEITGAFTISQDTIWFIYNHRPNLISMDCGFSTFYELLEVKYTTHRIDSIAIEESNVTNTLDEHLKIFPVVVSATTSGFKQ